MKRALMATCFAMVCAVGLAAQQTAGTTGTTDPQAGQRGGPRTFTGCLRAGDTTGTYMLTDIQAAPRPADTAGTTAGSTGGGTTTTGGSATGTGTAATAGQGRGQMPTTLALNPAADVDLKPHVGHKIEVTGTMSAGRRSDDAAGAGATTTTAPPPPPPQTTTGAQPQGGGRGTRTLAVTSVRMISESCS
ncbi:MAG TPA: hypothetical protein VL225_00910 [Vicinamibacterales bacterium]|nr:hypothetical protein [Vicinamibacterales bacterium]